MTSKPIAYQAYQELADAYAELIDTKPHNAYYDRPAMLRLLPDICGQKVLDAGCGPGAYTEQLVARGAHVIACDVSDRMLELAGQRLSHQVIDGRVELRLVDLTQPLETFEDRSIDLVNAPLCLDYIQDWRSLFSEFFRILKPGGWLLFSCGHPSFDAEYFDTQNYFSVERVHCVWKGFGVEIEMPSFRRSLEEVIMPVMDSGFQLDTIREPLPTEDFEASDPLRFQALMHRPAFICVRARKPKQTTT